MKRVIRSSTVTAKTGLFDLLSKLIDGLLKNADITERTLKENESGRKINEYSIAYSDDIWGKHDDEFWRKNNIERELSLRVLFEPTAYSSFDEPSEYILRFQTQDGDVQEDYVKENIKNSQVKDTINEAFRDLYPDHFEKMAEILKADNPSDLLDPDDYDEYTTSNGSGDEDINL